MSYERERGLKALGRDTHTTAFQSRVIERPVGDICIPLCKLPASAMVFIKRDCIDILSILAARTNALSLFTPPARLVIHGVEPKKAQLIRIGLLHVLTPVRHGEYNWARRSKAESTKTLHVPTIAGFLICGSARLTVIA